MSALRTLKTCLAITLACASLGITGCVRFNLQDSLAEAGVSASGFVQGDLQLRQSLEQQQSARLRAEEILSTELNQADAIELALVNSPAMQQLLASHWSNASTAAIAGGIANPVFEFGRFRTGSALEIERALAIGLLDLVRLPWQRATARKRLQSMQLQLTASIVERVTRIRTSWVAAVVAQQSRLYAEQVFSSAEASAKLAAKMQSIGNFSAIARARQQAFYASAATGLTISRHNALAAREQLVRLLGLDQAQASALRLPDRLPDLPELPVSFAEVTSMAGDSRLDVAMAMIAVESASAQQGIQLLAGVTDIELALARNSEWEDGAGETVRGLELGIELPLFNSIGQSRNRLNARSLAAVNELEQVTRAAASHLREAYSAYRSSYDIARHYRDEVVPLQQLVSEENVLKYNGMIIGVFELLADSRRQIETVQESIAATGQYWMADAALRASMIGKPVAGAMLMADAGGPPEGEAH